MAVVLPPCMLLMLASTSVLLSLLVMLLLKPFVLNSLNPFSMTMSRWRSRWSLRPGPDGRSRAFALGFGGRSWLCRSATRRFAVLHLVLLYLAHLVGCWCPPGRRRSVRSEAVASEPQGSHGTRRGHARVLRDHADRGARPPALEIRDDRFERRAGQAPAVTRLPRPAPALIASAGRGFHELWKLVSPNGQVHTSSGKTSKIRLNSPLKAFYSA